MMGGTVVTPSVYPLNYAHILVNVKIFSVTLEIMKLSIDCAAMQFLGKTATRAVV